MHFRNKDSRCSNFELKIGSKTIEYTSLYRYLEVHINKNLDSTTTAGTFSKAGGRALGAVVSKIQSHKDVGYKTYSKLFSSCVVPVLDYCSGVWGFIKLT